MHGRGPNYDWAEHSRPLPLVGWGLGDERVPGLPLLHLASQGQLSLCLQAPHKHVWMDTPCCQVQLRTVHIISLNSIRSQLLCNYYAYAPPCHSLSHPTPPNPPDRWAPPLDHSQSSLQWHRHLSPDKKGERDHCQKKEKDGETQRQHFYFKSPIIIILFMLTCWPIPLSGSPNCCNIGLEGRIAKAIRPTPKLGRTQHTENVTHSALSPYRLHYL